MNEATGNKAAGKSTFKAELLAAASAGKAARQKRVNAACDKLRSGQRRVCCFDPSGFYSKGLRAPRAAEPRA